MNYRVNDIRQWLLSTIRPPLMRVLNGCLPGALGNNLLVRALAAGAVVVSSCLLTSRLEGSRRGDQSPEIVPPAAKVNLRAENDQFEVLFRATTADPATASKQCHLFEVRRKGGVRASELAVCNATTEIVGLSLHRGKYLMIVGAARKDLKAVTIADAAALANVAEFFAYNPKLSPTGRHILFGDPETRLPRAFDLHTLRFARVWSASDGAVHFLRNGTLAEKITALSVIREKQLNDEPIRQALLAEFERAITEREALVRHRAAGCPVDGRVEGEAEDYLRGLMGAFDALRDPRVLPLLIRLDLLGTSGRIAHFGEAAIPLPRSRLSESAPPGQSEHYRAGLLKALSLEACSTEMSAARSQEIVTIARDVLARPGDWRALVEGIRLTECLDEESLQLELERLASDPQTIEGRGIHEPDSIRAVMNAAQAALEKRIAIE